MAQMAFYLKGAGFPLVGEVGLAAADVIIGIKTHYVRIYAFSAMGDTQVLAVSSRRPFNIKDDPLLPVLTNERVDLEVSGVGFFGADLSVGFKVYNGDGTVVYDETRLVETIGTCLGGWSMTGKRLKMVSPTSNLANMWKVMLGWH
jgi:hypothetical protein